MSINKHAVESAKTILIAVLITGIVSFTAGVRYAGNLGSAFNEKVEALTIEVQTENSKAGK